MPSFSFFYPNKTKEVSWMLLHHHRMKQAQEEKEEVKKKPSTKRASTPKKVGAKANAKQG